MHRHFSIDDEVWQGLALNNKTLMKSLAYFDPHKSQAPISKVSLLYYIDSRGDFQERRDEFDTIACAVFDTLNIKDKIEVAEYVDWESEDE